MNIVVHFPKTEEALHDLRCKVAEVHAKSIIDRVSRMNMTKDEKNTLIDAVIDKIHNNSKNQGGCS